MHQVKTIIIIMYIYIYIYIYVYIYIYKPMRIHIPSELQYSLDRAPPAMQFLRLLDIYTDWQKHLTTPLLHETYITSHVKKTVIMSL